MKKILIPIFLLCACNCDEHSAQKVEINKPDGVKKPVFDEQDIELVMTTYRKAWIDGANAATHAANYGEPFGEKTGDELMKKDSLAFRAILIEANKTKQ